MYPARFHNGIIGAHWFYNYTIDLIENKQTISGPVYKLDEVENLEDLYPDLANDLLGLQSHRSKIRSCSYLRKTKAFDLVPCTVISHQIRQTYTIEKTLVKCNSLKISFQTRNNSLEYQTICLPGYVNKALLRSSIN